MKFSTILFTSFLTLFIANILSAQCFTEQNFDTPGEHTYIIPGLATETFLIEVESRGADGGDFLWGGNPQVDGGEGATMGASFIVNGGDELFIIVGESGFDAIGSPGGGGGGGGTAVIINGTDVLIAAAAGGGGGQLQDGFGAGSSTNSTAAGGSGPGTSGGGGFNEDGEDGVGGTGGGAGTLTSQGAGGTQGVVAGPGGDGFGGGAGGSGTVGGGGGGYQGGDGASGSGGNYGGMGGDSYITTLYSSITLTTDSGSNGGGANIDGSVTISCIPTGSVDIEVISQNNPSCFDAPDGSIEVNALGGLAPFTYTIDGGSAQASGLFENLNAGTYSMMVEDGNGNTASVNVTLDDPAEVAFDIVEIVDVICFGSSDGSIEIIGSGGTSASGLYTYSIDGGVFQGSGLFTGLSAGSYNLAVQDDNGCTIDGGVSVGDQTEIVVIITNQTDASCAEATNGTVSFSSSGGQGGFSYSLDGINFQVPATFNSLEQGDYTVTIMDNGGCTTTLDFTIGIADPFTFLIIDTTDSSCDGTAGSVNMLASGGIGGFTYSIDGTTYQMSGSFAGLDAGTYTATASDGADCIQELEFTIGMSNNLTIEGTVIAPTCAGVMDGSIDLTLDDNGGPYTILWEGEGVVPDSEDQFDLGEGIYTVTVMDPNGCSITVDYEIPPGATLIIDGSDIQNPSCNGGADGMVTLSVIGGAAPYTFMLDGMTNNTGEFDGLTAGMYQIDVNDMNGCTGDITVTITEPDITLTLMVTNQTEAGCNGDTSGTVSLLAENGIGAYTYTIAGMTNGTGDFIGLAGGSYTASATDENGCSVELNVIILENSTLTGAIVTINHASCNGGSDGSVTVQGEAGSGTYIYSLDNLDSQTIGEFNEISAGSHSVTITDTEGCSFIISFDITEPTAIALLVDNVNDASCFGVEDGSITFHIEGGTAPYNLTSGGNEIEIMENEMQTFDDLLPGTYAVFVTDANGCTIESSVTVGSPTEIVFVEDYLTHVTCFGAEDATIGFHIEGGTPPYILTNVAEGGEIEVPDNNIIELDNGGPDVIELVISDANGCTMNHTITVNEPDILEFIINEQLPVSCFGAEDAYISFMIIGGTAPYNIIDNEGDTLEIEDSAAIESNEAEPGIYPLTIIDANGCTIETVVTISEPELLAINNIIIVDSDETNNGSITIEAIGGTGPYTYALNDTDFQAESTFTGLAEGNYQVTVLDANGCTVTTGATIVSTDVNDISSDVLSLSVGPNPASQLIHIKMVIKEMVEMKIHLIDIQGKSVMEINQEVTLGDQTISLDVASLHSGIYMINVITNRGHFTKRVIVQH